jgi:3-isopropylmalate/(R)-2-methylmalate dehydratase small subunit
MISGRVWIFGDNISTDLILPGSAVALSETDQVNWIFHANRPGWIDLVEQGDILVAGNNFGIGSARPAARSLRNLGIAAVVANSISRLFLRNAVNFGLLALEAPGVATVFREGEMARILPQEQRILSENGDVEIATRPLPAALLARMLGGGAYAELVRDGHIRG